MSEIVITNPDAGLLKMSNEAQEQASGCASATGSVTLDYQTAHDAELMLWTYLYCMDRGIIPPKEGWVREAVAETRKKLAAVTKAKLPNAELSDRRENNP